MEIVPRYEGLRFSVTQCRPDRRPDHSDRCGRQFCTFLPVGEYTITLDRKTLVEHTDCKDHTRTFKIEAGKVNELESFAIEIKSRTVNVKKFFAE